MIFTAQLTLAGWLETFHGGLSKTICPAGIIPAIAFFDYFHFSTRKSEAMARGTPVASEPSGGNVAR
jgi:hypothetical protein